MIGEIIINGKIEVATINKSTYVSFEPKEDITAYELSRIVGMLQSTNTMTTGFVPEGCERHFRVIE